MKKTRCFIAVIDANGCRDLIPLIVRVSEEDFNEGTHYIKAEGWAEDQAYNPILVMDEQELSNPKFMECVDWGEVEII
jgi:hypothetical protein